MYAIIETGGKQYRVCEGDIVRVEKLPAREGEQVELDKVVACKSEEGFQLGQPYLDGCSVKARVRRQGRGKKITVFKYRPKKNYRRKKGHRQPYTELKIESINMGA